MYIFLLLEPEYMLSKCGLYTLRSGYNYRLNLITCTWGSTHLDSLSTLQFCGNTYIKVLMDFLTIIHSKHLYFLLKWLTKCNSFWSLWKIDYIELPWQWSLNYDSYTIMIVTLLPSSSVYLSHLYQITVYSVNCLIRHLELQINKFSL